MTEKNLRLIVFCVVSAGAVALAYMKQDATPLLAIVTYLMKSPTSNSE